MVECSVERATIEYFCGERQSYQTVVRCGEVERLNRLAAPTAVEQIE